MPIIRSSGPIDKVIAVTTAVINHLGSELPTLNSEQKEERLEICRGCEFYNHLTTQCGQCGCIMNFKAFLPLEKCPIDKWGIHPIAQNIINQHSVSGVTIGECQTC